MTDRLPLLYRLPFDRFVFTEITPVRQGAPPHMSPKEEQLGIADGARCFTGRMPLLSPNQHRHNADGKLLVF